jgi:hypothetical protein
LFSSGRRLSEPENESETADLSRPPPPIQQPVPKQQQPQLQLQQQQQQQPLKPKYDTQQLISVTKMQAMNDGDRYLTITNLLGG